MLFLTLFVVPPTSLCAPEDLKDGDINVREMPLLCHV